MAPLGLDAQVYADAKLVYEYHHMHMGLHPADAIFCLCSIDTRVAERAAQLFLDGLAPLLIFAGGLGRLTDTRFTDPEAVVFSRIAIKMGVPEDRILLEPRSTNTGENVRFTYEMLADRKDTMPKNFILVQKPYMERRTYATFRKQWPGQDAEFTVTSPKFSFDEYPDHENTPELVINAMVGDLVRIKDYAVKGFQIPQEMPDEVWDAGQRLINAGYNTSV